MGSNLWSSRRVAGAAGIGFAVSFGVTLVIGATGPIYDDPVADVREFFVDNDTRVHLSTLILALGFVFFLLPFAAGLRNLLAPADEADEQMWSRLSYTGAALAAAIALVGSAFWEVLSQGTAEDLSDEALLVVARLDTVSFLVVLPWALALFIAAASVVIVRSGVLAKWIGWLGAAGALLLVIGTLWIFSEDDESLLTVLTLIGLAITVLWALTVGITMIRSDQPVTTSDA